MLEITNKGLKSDGGRILEIVPVFRMPMGDMICLPSAFYPFDGRLIGMTENYVMGYPYEGWIQGGSGYLPADNSSMTARLELRFRVHENMAAMRPMSWSEIVGDIISGKLEEHNGETPAGQSETETL